jgi:sugar fermentation stimulation protein A
VQGWIKNLENTLTDMDSGVYIAVFFMRRSSTIQVGRLGRFHFHRGIYFYTGSAQRNLSARLERHGRNKKSLHWHIDYLSVNAEMIGAITIQGQRKHECEVAAELGKMFEGAVHGFGASDCRCTGHLFYAPELP